MQYELYNPSEWSFDNSVDGRDAQLPTVAECMTESTTIYCLREDTLASTTCCPNVATLDCAAVGDDEHATMVNDSGNKRKQCTTSCKQSQLQYPALCIGNSGADVTNRWLKDMLAAPDVGSCWTQDESKLTVTETGEAGKKKLSPTDGDGHTFAGSMPPENGANFHCKLQVDVDRATLLTADAQAGTGSAAGSGYLYFIAEQYCFENWVKVVVQPYDKYLNFNYRSQTTDPALMTKVFKSTFGRRFLVPAEYVVYLDVSPTTANNAETCTKGEFLFSVQHVTDAEAAALSTSTEKPYENVEGASDADKAIETKDLIEYVERLAVAVPDEDTGVTPAYTDVVIDGGAAPTDDEPQYEEIDTGDTLPTQTVSAITEDGQAPKNLYETVTSDETLFTVGDTEITVEQTFWAASGTLIIILIVVAVCCAVSFYKRKRIAAEARRASNYVRRSTAQLRASIRKARGKPTPEDEQVKPMTEKEINKVASDGAANKNEKEFLKDMINDQEAQKEGGFQELEQFSSNNSALFDNKIVPQK